MPLILDKRHLAVKYLISDFQAAWPGNHTKSYIEKLLTDALTEGANNYTSEMHKQTVEMLYFAKTDVRFSEYSDYALSGTVIQADQWVACTTDPTFDLKSYLPFDGFPGEINHKSTAPKVGVLARLKGLISDLSRIVACPHDHKTVWPTCPSKAAVSDLVIHLNDSCKWTREQVADWLDTLDLDLRFPTPSTEDEVDLEVVPNQPNQKETT